MAVLTPVFKEKYVEITFDKDNEIIKAKWKGFLKLDEVKKGCAEITKLIKNNKLTKHASDQVDLKVLSKDVQNYLTLEWFPEVQKLGLRKIGVVVSQDVFAQATVNNVNTKSQKDQLVFNTFNDEIQCVRWLNQVN